MMSKLLFVVAAVACAAVGANAAAASATFCQRYAAALFTTATSTTETNLISAVVDRALSGNTTVTANGMRVRGILASPIQTPFFTTPTNFYNDATARNALVAKLKAFFTVAFGCREVTVPSGSFSTNMGTVHAGMNISSVVWNDFVGELVATLRSFGVIDADITYAGAVLGQFAYGAGSNQICNYAGDCPRFTTYASFISGTIDASGNRAWIDQSSTDQSDNTVDISLGGYVHWDMTTTHSVVQTDSSFAPLVPAGWSSGAVDATMSYTLQFNTAGVYYFKCGNPNHPTMQGVINVAQTPGGTASGLTASIGVVAAAIAAVFVARRI